MSTYVNETTGKNFKVSELLIPDFMKDYLNNIIAEKSGATRTAINYYQQLKSFLAWAHLKYTTGSDDPNEIKNCNISDMKTSELGVLTAKDISSYISYLSTVQHLQGATLKLRISSMKSLYRYLTEIEEDPYIERNPMLKIKAPSTPKKAPKYLEINECKQLLEAVYNEEGKQRDYCMITLLINCGMRVQELIGIDLIDCLTPAKSFEDGYTFKEDSSLLLYGKGQKERKVFLNDACKNAINMWLNERWKIKGAYEEPALFISSVTGKRLTIRRAQQIVEDSLTLAGLGNRGFSPHKLRHTCATMLYNEGSANVLELQAMLGHNSVNTTEVYTHFKSEKVKNMMSDGPLAHFTPEDNQEN